MPVAIDKFAETLFLIYPNFIPTNALYLDLEGRQGGSEDILSFYWPKLSGPIRFSWIKRTQTSEINLKGTETHLQSIDAINPRSIVVYSAGQSSPDEQSRLIDLLGQDPFPNNEWVNLLHVAQNCSEIKGSIRGNRHVWYSTDRVRTRYSLEALEWEFGINRPLETRSHSNHYKDLDGGPGGMEVLATAQRSISGLSTSDDERTLLAYCESDVKNMFEIASTCERLMFSASQRRGRRRH